MAFNQLFRRAAAPSLALVASTFLSERSTDIISKPKSIAFCEAPNHLEKSPQIKDAAASLEKAKEIAPAEIGKQSLESTPDKEEFFHGLFPLRQLWKPTHEYPLWDSNWDGRKPDDNADRRYIRKNGVTRHIILVRHGQYDETHKEDEKRILTPLGRKQAALTGQRLADMIKGFNKDFGPCNITTIRVSDMTRAKETCDIIASFLPDSVKRAEPDPTLNEGRPCHTVPAGKCTARSIAVTDEGNKRIEKAFKGYFYRHDPPARSEKIEGEKDVEVNQEKDGDDEDKDLLEIHPQHEFEIIVCHANVIRYFLMRALQLPPEAWLRLCTFNCSLNYITIRPSGSCACRMLGDIGHLNYEHSTFSMHHGFNW